MYCATFYTHYANTAMSGSARLQVTTLRVPLPLPTVEPTSCPAGQYVVLSSAEYLARTASPFNLDLAEAGPIVGAVLAVWAVGWGVRQAIRALRGGG